MNRVARWLWEERQFQIRLVISCLFFETDEVGLLADYNEGDFAEKTLTSLDNPMSHERIGRSARDTALGYDCPALVQGLEELYYRTLGSTDCPKATEAIGHSRLLRN